MGADWSVKHIVIATKEWRECACSAHCFIVCLFTVSGQGLLDGESQQEISFSLSLCQQEFTIWLIYLFRPWGNSPPLTPPPAPLQNGWNHQNYFSLLNLKENWTSYACVQRVFLIQFVSSIYFVISRECVSSLWSAMARHYDNRLALCMDSTPPPPPPPPKRRSVNPLSVSPLGVTQGSLAFRPFKVAWSPVYTFCTLMYTTVVIL